MWLSNGTQQTWITFDLGACRPSPVSTSGTTTRTPETHPFTLNAAAVRGHLIGSSLLANGSLTTRPGRVAIGAPWRRASRSARPAVCLLTRAAITRLPVRSSAVISRFMSLATLRAPKAPTTTPAFRRSGSTTPSPAACRAARPSRLPAARRWTSTACRRRWLRSPRRPATAHVYLGGANLTVGDSTTTTFAGMISDSGGANSNTGGSLTKVGAGTLVLSGSNSYRGSTIVGEGTLVAASAGTLPDGTSLTVGAGQTAFVFDPSLAGTGGFRRGPQSRSRVRWRCWRRAQCWRLSLRGEGDQRQVQPFSFARQAGHR